MTAVHELRPELIEGYVTYLLEEERSENTIGKYQRDLNAFYNFCGENTLITKEIVLRYKEYLGRKYAVSSANSMLAALNSFFHYLRWADCVVKAFKVQRQSFRQKELELTKEEYIRLLRAAQGKGKEKLYLLMETIGATGIRISELPFITVEAAESGQAHVTLKGKTRTVLLPVNLRRKLKDYAKEKGIESGSIFVTRNGNPLDRSNVFHMMRRLGKTAGVSEKKIFPHNFRHLFAVTYYQSEKDLAHLADVLGHANVNTTRIYTMISSEEQAKNINQLGLIL